MPFKTTTGLSLVNGAAEIRVERGSSADSGVVVNVVDVKDRWGVVVVEVWKSDVFQFYLARN